MREDLAKAFTDAVTTVLSTMAMVEVRPSGTHPKEGNHTFGAVTGIIGMASPSVHAVMSLSFERNTILEIISSMIAEKVVEVNDEVLDAVGELTNMICGDAKRRLSDLGVSVEMATPLVVSGDNVRVREKVTRKTTVLCFDTDFGKLVLESNLVA